MRPVRVLAACHSPTDGDAIARYLRTVPWIEVVAEACDLPSLHALGSLPGVDVVLVNDRLPGNDRPDAVVAALAEAYPEAGIVRIQAVPTLRRPPSAVRAVLTGAFGASRLLEAIRHAAGRTPVVAVASTMPGVGVTGTALLLAAAAFRRWPLGRVVLLDRAPNRLLTALRRDHPLLNHPRLGDAGEGVVVIVDAGTDPTAVPEDVSSLVAVEPTGLRALVAASFADVFGRPPDATLGPPHRSPVETGRWPPPHALAPYLRLLPSEKGETALGPFGRQRRARL
jgi:hypothetical protein